MYHKGALRGLYADRGLPACFTRRENVVKFFMKTDLTNEKYPLTYNNRLGGAVLSTGFELENLYFPPPL